MPAPSGLTPSDSCYVKHLPASYGVQEVQQLFETHGAVLDVKLFPCLGGTRLCQRCVSGSGQHNSCGVTLEKLRAEARTLHMRADQFRGASALVRMASLEAADRAIAALNNSTPPGAVQSLIVRFAESAAEKAARLSRREAKSMQRLGTNSVNGVSLVPDQLQQALSAFSLGGGMGGLSPQAAALRTQLPPAPLVPQSYQPQVLSSICIKGEPSCLLSRLLFHCALLFHIA